MTISVHVDAIRQKRPSPNFYEKHDEATFHSSAEVLKFMVEDPDGENIIRAALEERFKKSPAFKRYSRCRSIIRDSPCFKKYRSSIGSEEVHRLAKEVATGKSVSSPQISLLNGLSLEIQNSKTEFAEGQTVFHGTSREDASGLYMSPMPSFLSTTLSIQVAYWHAKKRAKPVVCTNKFQNTPLVLELELSEPLNGFFAPAGKLQEYEILFDRYLKVTPSGSSVSLSNGTILQKAKLQKA